jgi:hypothetical protein
MVASNTTPKVCSKSATVPPAAAAAPTDSPLDTINEKLAEAHATLDLLHTIATSMEANSLLSSLSAGTLIHALDSAMYCIGDARQAAERIPSLNEGTRV